MKIDKNQQEVLLNSIGNDQYIEISIDHHVEWMRNILSELHEEITDDLREEPELLKQASLKFEGDLQKRSDSYWRDHALLVGELKACYWTQCIKSGELMLEEQDLDIQAVFINESLQKTKNLEEADTLMIENYEYDLYFYKSSMIDISEVLHEQLFLNKNPYPVKKAQAGERS